jgi:hypothetical protein
MHQTVCNLKKLADMFLLAISRLIIGTNVKFYFPQFLFEGINDVYDGLQCYFAG